MGIFIAVVIILLVLIYFMIVMLRSVIGETNRKINDYFLTNLDRYDGMFKEKLGTMNKMYEEHELLSRELRSVQNELIANRTSPFYAPRPLPRDVFVPIARYVDNDFFEEYKVAKDKLAGIDKQEVINHVIDVVPFTGDMTLYQTADRIVTGLNFQALYDLCSIEHEDQLSILRETLTGDELRILSEYVEEMEEVSEFEVLGFLDYVKAIRRRHDPHVFVSVAENETDYTNPARNIICSVDPNVCEGVKIIYQNKVYDYSIYRTRRKVGS